MSMEKSRTKEQIFADLHREMRVWNPDVPESPERLDPVMRILLQLYSHQLARIDTRIDQVWDVAGQSVLQALCPEGLRWPIPAYTVMRCQAADPVITVDPHTRFFYKERREGGHTFFFSSMRPERLLAAEVKHVFLKTDRDVLDLSPVSMEDSLTMSQSPAQLAGMKSGQVYIAVDFTGNPTDFIGATVFLTGAPESVRQLRWGRWYPGSNFGGFFDDSGFCPGGHGSLDEMLIRDDRAVAWGAVRSSGTVFKKLEDHLVVLPERFASTWEIGPADETLTELLSNQGISLNSDSGRYYWIRIDLPPGGDKSKLAARFGIYFNCFIAINKNEQTLFKHTGGNRLLEIELPEELDSILQIVSVADSNGKEYVPSYEIRTDAAQGVYSLENRNGNLVLWFDFSSSLELPPDSVTVSYATTAGTDANGIAAAKITELYENHPGILAAENVIPTAGAIPARTDKQTMSEVSARLRSRDRALSFSEISNWAGIFDPRIRQAVCRNGIQRAEHGVRRCIVVRVSVSAQDFHSEEELDLLRIRLADFLKSRSAVNTQYSVEITAA